MHDHSLRVPGAMQRVALAKRCFAEPGPRFLRVASNRGPGSAAHRSARAPRCAASGERDPNKNGAEGPARLLTNPVKFWRGFVLDEGNGIGRDASGRDGLRRQSESDFFDVLGGCGEQALAGNGEQASKTRVAMAVKLFGVGEGTFDGLFASLVDSLAPRGEPMRIAALARVCPDMADNQAGGGAVGGA